jgi:ATP-dependent helicase/nuclease subunit A
MDTHEASRLLYVAATRARDHLFVSGHHRAKRSSHAATMFEAAQQHGGLVRAVARPEPAKVAIRSTNKADDDSGPVANGQSERQEWRNAREAALESARKPSVIAASSLSEAHRPSGQGRKGTAIGSALHALMEQLDFESVAGLDALAQRCAAAEGISEEADSIAAMATRTLDSDAIRLAREFSHHRELFVSAPFGERVIEGYVDLLIEGPNGLVVVDYKTDLVDDPTELEAAYRLQLAAYAHCIEVSTAMPVVSAVLLCCATSPPIVHPIDLALARQALGGLIDR